MKTICVVTSNRAEYGLLRRLIVHLTKSGFDVRVVVTGAHLLQEMGNTYQEIEKDGINIDAKIPIQTGGNTEQSISETMANAIMGFSSYFDKIRPDILIVLGDRYEIFSVCSVAMIYRIPIAHIHGGETTEGAIDECIRHAITKMSYLHFTSMEEYRNRVIQLGENPERVFNVGALGIENAINTKYLSKEQLEREIGFKLQYPYGILTFHPTTLEKDTVQQQVSEILAALLEFKDSMNFIITGANTDYGADIINNMFKMYASKNKNVLFYSSLGTVKYLSALKYAHFVIGNSSSGIIEVPSFGIPTINIGDRQKGRIQAKSIINIKANKQEIVSVINRILQGTEEENCNRVNPYGIGDTSERIGEILKMWLDSNGIELKKSFYNLPVIDKMEPE